MTRRPTQPRADITPAERDRLAHWVPILVRSGVVSDWERGLCIACLAQIRKGPWWPSQKVAPILQRLVGRFQEAMGEDQVVVEPVTADEMEGRG